MRDALRNPRTLRMAGGTIAVIGGIYASLIGFVMVFAGGLGVFSAGWADAGFSPVTGLVCGLMIIFLGALAINARGPFPGIMTAICAIIGAIVGGLLLTLFMILPLIGGGLAAAAAQREVAGDTTSRTSATATRRNAR